MKHILCTPDIDIIAMIRDTLLQDPDRMSDNLVVFPGKRPTHFLRKSLADALGKPFMAPHLMSMDEFIDHMFRTFDHDAAEIAAIDSIPILFDLNQRESFIAAQGDPLTLDDFLPWGFRLYSDFEEMHIEAIRPERLAEVEVITKEGVPQRIKDRLATLSRLYSSFYGYIESSHLSTRATRYRAVAEECESFDVMDYSHIIFAGFFALTASERKVLRYFTQHGNVTFVLQKGPAIENIINDLGIEVEEQGRPLTPSVHFYKAMDVHSEVMQLGVLLREAKDRDHRSVIVMPRSDALFPVIHHALGSEVEVYNVSVGYPLYRTPLFSLIDTIGQCLESRYEGSYYVPDYLKVILHPYVKNVLMERSNEPTRIIVHTIEDYLVENKYRFISLDTIENDPDVLEQCAKRLQGSIKRTQSLKMIQPHIRTVHNIFFRVFERIDTVGDFVRKMMELISFLAQKSTANLHPYTGPFMKTMLEALFDLSTSALDDESFLRTNGYFRLLSNYVRSIRYPFAGTPIKGLQVLGSLETRTLRFDTVYILDVNEGIVPNVRKEDTMLPYKVRKYLGLPTHEERERIARYYFEVLLNGAHTVHVLYCESENKEKSRFVERIIWQRQKETRTLDAKTRDVFFRVSFVHRDPQSIPKTDDMTAYISHNPRFSASSLNTYLQCPLLFYYTNILGLSMRGMPLREVDPLDRGSVIHHILEEFFIRKAGKKLSITDKDYRVMDSIVDEQFNTVFPRADQGSLMLLKLQVKRRMKDVLQFYRGSDFAHTTVLECENRTGPHTKRLHYWEALYTTPFLTGKGIKATLSGKIDRVDDRNGTRVILDYKSGSHEEVPKRSFDLGDRASWYKTLVSVQLPVYILLYQGKHPDRALDAINCGLVLLGTRAIKEIFLFKPGLTAQEKNAVFEQYTGALSILIEELLEPDIPFVPTAAPEKFCGRCDFKVMCDRQWIE
ncbi:PD-(D/E)XK nuclease family protein [candidate division WOR-3 bacterium]|nr:PD-(D/E)XK nuclease family protein [candidate division WOR-3 bacterium]